GLLRDPRRGGVAGVRADHGPGADAALGDEGAGQLDGPAGDAATAHLGRDAEGEVHVPGLEAVERGGVVVDGADAAPVGPDPEGALAGAVPSGLVETADVLLGALERALPAAQPAHGQRVLGRGDRGGVLGAQRREGDVHGGRVRHRAGGQVTRARCCSQCRRVSTRVTAATPASRAANSRVRVEGRAFAESGPPSIPPAAEPPANTSVVTQSMSTSVPTRARRLEAVAMTMTSRLVPEARRIARPSAITSIGTTMNPPPTPKKPVRKPVSEAAAITTPSRGEGGGAGLSGSSGSP